MAKENTVQLYGRVIQEPVRRMDTEGNYLSCKILLTTLRRTYATKELLLRGVPRWDTLCVLSRNAHLIKHQMEGCNSLYQWLQGKEDDDFLFKNQPNLTADEAFAVIYYLQERFHVIPDTIEKCACCNELYDSEDADVQEKIGDERERACCRNCCCEEEEIRNIEVFYRRDDKVLISKKELIQLIEDDKTDEIISRFKPGYIPGCILEELAEKLQLPYFQECGADDIDID